jgi:RHS repeat-associated protein
MADDRPSPANSEPSPGPQAPQLSLPKGGGAIRGLGESFSADTVTGAGTFRLPIRTSPARAGMAPQLALAYSSGQGNGPFGWGWSVELPAITRRTDKGLPRYEDASFSDIFLLTGAGELTPLVTQPKGDWVVQPTTRALYQNTYEVTQYRPRVEAQFARIERWRNLSDATDVFWRTISRANVTSWYGLSKADRVFDPADPTRIFSWLVSQAYDDQGNAIAYVYKAEDSQGVDLSACNERNRTVQTRGAQRYVKLISYGNRTPYALDLTAAQMTPLPPATDWCFSLVFDYGEHDLNQPTIDEPNTWICRADPFSTYRPTFELRTYRLCRRILAFHNFPGEAVGAYGLVRAMTLAHATTPADPTQPFYSYLLSVTETGYADGGAAAAQSSAPPLAFSYSLAEIDDTVREADPATVANLPTGIDGSTYRWVDLDGEGSPGVLTEQGNAWFYKANLSAAHVSGTGAAVRASPAFAAVQQVERLPSLAALSGGRQQLLALSGDGQLALTQFDGASPGYFERTADAGWTAFQPFVSLPVVDWRDPNLRFVDLTGDGFPDVLISGDYALTWCESLSTEGFGPAQRAPMADDEERGPKLVFADGDESIFLADMTGDNLTDLVRVRVGEVCYWPNLGYGQFGTKVTLDGAPLFDRPDQFDPRRVQLADIDGSGAADILYFAAGAVRIWFNQSGNGLAQGRTLGAFPDVDPVSRAQVLDLLGSGTACLVWSSPLPAAAGAPLRYVDLMGGTKPHLMTGVVNNLGAETVVTYAPSTRFYVTDKLAGTPWITRLPFPVQVVAQIETRDRIGRNRFVSSYAYHHGYYDGVEREFRGFARVDQADTGELAALGDAAVDADETNPPANENAASDLPPVLTKTWFHTGCYFDGGSILEALQGEYFHEAPLPGGADPTPRLPPTPLPDQVMLGDGSHQPYAFSPEEWRQACRSLRGSVLRREVYALDGGAAEAQPFQTTEHNYTIEVLQPCGPNPYASFLPHARETLELAYERTLFRVNGGALVNPSAPPAPGDRMAADPRAMHSVTLATDAYGDELITAKIGYGRRFIDPSLGPVDQASQATMLATAAINSLTNPITTADANRTPLPAQADSYQVLQLAPAPATPGTTALIDFQSLSTQLAGATDIPFEDDPPTGLTAGLPYRRLTSRTRTLYRPDDLGQAAGSADALLPLKTLDPLALPGQIYMLALTPGLIPKVFVRGGTPLLPTPATVLVSQAADGGGYADLDGDGSAWAPAARVYYAPAAATPAQELASAKAHFFQPMRYVDPFGAATVVAYDTPNNLTPASVTDAAGNVTSVTIDYRALAPSLLTDANLNQTSARFDARGQLVGTAVAGKSGEGLGDTFTTFDADPTQAQIDAFFSAADPHTLAAGLLGTATTRVVYDLQRYLETSQANPGDDTTWQPVYAATLSRTIHESDLSGGAVSPIQISFSYSDGFGREIQKKVEAEPDPAAPGSGPRWIGDGWSVLNNKGKPVRKYEPFFSALAGAGHHFEFAVLTSVAPILCYDPLDRVVATVHPNQTYEKTAFDPWTQALWDVNDTSLQDNPAADPDVGPYLARLPAADLTPTWRVQRAGGALGPDEQAAAVKTAAHANTPTVKHLDVLGREALTVDNNGAAGKYPTRVQLDIQRRHRTITDALGRTAATFDYDLLGARLRETSMEAGQRWQLNDAAGKAIRNWDSRGHNRRTAYDALRRPTGQFVLGTDPANSDPRTLGGEVCYESVIYGEGQPTDQALNLRTRVYRRNDPTGYARNSAPNPTTQQTQAYDFKGNQLGGARQFVAAVDTLTNWSGAAPQFGPTYTTAATFDALNRATSATTPDGAVTTTSYNARNLLQATSVQPSGAGAPTPFVTAIAYDAKGQRQSITYGNAGTNTAYAYNPLTFRLTSLTTTRPGAPAGQQIVQALSYVYDPKGNITHIQDDADIQNTVFFKNRRVDPSADYTYDALYRLIAASGREQLGLAGATLLAPTPTSYNDAPRVGLLSPGDGQAMGTYAETYAYDAVGNLSSLAHTGSNPANPGWTRTYAYNEKSLIDPTAVSNRLSSATVGGQADAFAYDLHGNVTAMPQLQAMQWDLLDQLEMTRRQAVGAGDADGQSHQGERTYYAYDQGGKRARKTTLSGAGVLIKQRWYLGGWELYQKYDAGGGVTLERQTLSVVDGARRIALIDTKTQDASAPAASLPSTATRYQYGNHLGSACLELDPTAAVVTYEEYYPFGGTSYQAGRNVVEASLKRYRFAGKERDEESGLSLHGARYYASWLGRWTACDPAGYVDGDNLYAYCHDNPVVMTDPGGAQAKPNAQGSAPDVHYRIPPTLKERVDKGILEQLHLDPSVPPPSIKPIDFAQLYRAVYGVDPITSLPTGSPTPSLPSDIFAPIPILPKKPSPSLFPIFLPIPLTTAQIKVTTEGALFVPPPSWRRSGIAYDFFSRLYVWPQGDINIDRSALVDTLRETPAWQQQQFGNRENVFTSEDAKKDPYLDFVINTLGVGTFYPDDRVRSPALIPLFTIDPSINVGLKLGKNRDIDLRFTYSPAAGNNVIGLSPLFPPTQGQIPGGDMLLQAIGHQPNLPAASYTGISLRTPF